VKELTLVIIVDGQAADKTILHDVRSKLLQFGALVQFGFSSLGTAQFKLCKHTGNSAMKASDNIRDNKFIIK